MGVDTSIYSILKPLDIQTDGASKGLDGIMNMRQLASQQKLIDTKTAHENQDYADKQKEKSLLAVGGVYDGVMNLPKEQRESAWNEGVDQLVKAGHIKPESALPYSERTAGMIGYQLHMDPTYQALKKNSLESQKLQDEVKYSQESRDPNSEVSKRINGALAKTGLGDAVSGLPYEQVQKIIPVLEKNQEARMRAQDRASNQDTKAGEKQDKAYSELRNHMESFRGNQAAQQAARDVLSADKTLAMVANKDPNTMTTQDLSLLASEMAKIATGGVPSEHGVQQLMPNNLNTKIAEMQSFLMSKPSDANAADYIQKNMEYLKEMSNVANGTLKNYRSNIAKGYKNRVKKEDLDEVMNDYGLSGEQKKKAPITSEDAEALHWAKQNKSDPRAQDILKGHGEM